jgi:SAM-dependent methyltransferase
MTAPGLDDQRYLQTEQYRDDANLAARIALHQRFSLNREPWQRWVFGHLMLPDHARVLELGCGRGDLWWENRDRISATWRLVLTDLSPGMIAAARQRLIDPPVEFAVADAQALPYADSAFDLVVANHMLYHVPDRPSVFHEIRRVLRPEGRMIAAANGDGHLRELAALARRHAPEVMHEMETVGFSLDNGAEQLRPWFAHVRRDEFPDGLAITEVEPLVAYVCSTRAGQFLDAERVAALRAEVEERIAVDGAFRVTKRAGIFQCRVEAEP